MFQEEVSLSKSSLSDRGGSVKSFCGLFCHFATAALYIVYSIPGIKINPNSFRSMPRLALHCGKNVMLQSVLFVSEVISCSN
jgi:hypothetical protein